ncbi:hypothetical protein DFH06DRAFT_1147861 [Mycena polygramma]|nr:hypothetical protein DFH06DRAFT_1147861 [Mycena polygramma]
MSGTLISVPHMDLTFRGLAIANDIVEDVNGARVWTALVDTCGVATIRYHPTSGGKCDGDISCPRVITPLFNDSTFTSVLNVQSKRSHKGVAWSLGPKECGNDSATISTALTTSLMVPNSFKISPCYATARAVRNPESSGGLLEYTK